MKPEAALLDANRPTTSQPNGRRAFSVETAFKRMGLGRTSFYDEIKHGRLRTFKVGARRLVAEDAIDEWIAAREAETLTPPEATTQNDTNEPVRNDATTLRERCRDFAERHPMRSRRRKKGR